MKISKFLLFTLLFIVGQFSFHANADAIKTVGTSGADYANLRLAFNAINAGTITGAIDLQIIDNVNETSTAVLYQSGYNSVSNYSSIKVYPTVIGKTIITSGTFSYLITLNAANNVTFDGRLHDASGNLVGSTKDLTLINTAVASGVMVFQFLNNASNNTITYCNIKGSNTASGKGVISFITPTTATVSGSANNTISYNTFTYAGTARPYCVIYSEGIATSPNTDNKLLNNHFVNCLVIPGTIANVNIAANNTAWTISGNSFFETENVDATLAGSYTFITVTGGSSHIISNNYIGGSEAQCGGSALTKTGNFADVFRGIFINSSVTTGLPTIVENNTIRNISWNNGTATAECRIIATENTHDVIIKGNTIKDVSITNNSTGSHVSGIYKSNGTLIQDIKNNFICGLTSSATTSGQLYGIRLAGGLSSVSNNIISLNTDNAVEIIGIYDSGAAGKTTQMYFNTVQIGGLHSAGTKGSYVLWSQGKDNTRDFRNNIFVNTRSNNGATGKHYAAYFNYSVNTNLTMDYNNYFVSGAGSVLGGYAWGDKTTLPIVTGKDVASVNVNPGFANASGTAAVDFKPAYSSSLNGDNTVTGYTDFGNNSRIIPTIGAWEVAAGLGTSLIDNRNEKSIIIIRNESGIVVPLSGESIVELYTNSGLLIEITTTNGAYTRKLADGMYIIRINGKAVKFVK